MASLSDTLYLTNPNATPTTTWDITATFAFDGTASNASNLVISQSPHSTYAYLDYVYNSYGDTAANKAEWNVNNGTPNCGIDNQGGGDTILIPACGTTTFTTTMTIAVTGQTVTVPIGMEMQMESGGNDVADFSNTASVTLNLPTGVAFSSASDQFLTAQNPVPEPGAAWLVLTALALLAIGKLPPAQQH